MYSLAFMSILFIGFCALTFFRLRQASYIVEKLTTCQRSFNPFRSQGIKLILFYDEFTCYKTRKYLKKLHEHLTTRKLDFYFINVSEGMFQGQPCQVCPFLEKYNINVLPSVILLKDGRLISMISNGPDHLSYKQIHHFINEQMSLLSEDKI